jgi:7-carboxy-7-deazaguanine synthase (Cx14CxxC type)
VRHLRRLRDPKGGVGMSYLVNDIFYTLQGEGSHAGRPAVFVRFAKCNLWTGRESDRASAVCTFCDTEFTTIQYRIEDPLDHLPSNSWDERTPMVVLTGGEPMLQVDRALMDALYDVPLYVAIETNGTQPIPFYIDWVCVSPKILTRLTVARADEVKLVYPQPGVTPEAVHAAIDAESYRLQPMDGPLLAENTRAAIDYCLAHPHWSLSVQTHKTIGVK